MRQDIQIAGFFKLEKHSEQGDKILDTGWMPNLVLDQGISALIAATVDPYCFYRFLKVGTGTTTPQPHNTTIQQVASKESMTNARYWDKGFDSDGGYHYRRGSVQFGKGEAAGNISEVAAGWNNTAGAIFARARVLDFEGNPTTITVLSNEYLTLTYELRSWFSTPAPHTLTYSDDGVTKSTLVTYAAAISGQGGAPGNGKWDVVVTPPGILTIDTTSASSGISRATLLFRESEGNPEITSVRLNGNNPPCSLLPHVFSPAAPNLVTFTPPISKTNEFEVSIDFEFKITRRV